MQHAGGIAHATGVHRHINDLLLDRRRLPGVGLVEQTGLRKRGRKSRTLQFYLDPADYPAGDSNSTSLSKQ